MQNRSLLRPPVCLLVAAVVSLPFLAPGARAGIMRNVLEDLHIVKPPPPPAPAADDRAPPFQGFACCNLHYDSRSIGDTNYASLPLIPAGTPIDVVSYDGRKANISIEGKPLQLSQDKSADVMGLGSWVNKVVVKDDPRPRIRSFPPAIQEAIRQGKLALGMTREQVIIAVGYPLPNENITLDAPTWKLYRARREEYDLNFNGNGNLESVTGDDSTTSAVLYQPKK
jgi:hypothetical protein